MDVLVREGHVLQDRQETSLARDALDRVANGMNSDQRVKGPTVMTGWQVRGPRDGERGGGQELLDREPTAQPGRGLLENPAGVGVLDELHQGLDLVGKAHRLVHDRSLSSG